MLNFTFNNIFCQNLNNFNHYLDSDNEINTLQDNSDFTNFSFHYNDNFTFNSELPYDHHSLIDYSYLSFGPYLAPKAFFLYPITSELLSAVSNKFGIFLISTLIGGSLFYLFTNSKGDVLNLNYKEFNQGLNINELDNYSVISSLDPQPVKPLTENELILLMSSSEESYDYESDNDLNLDQNFDFSNNQQDPYNKILPFKMPDGELNLIKTNIKYLPEDLNDLVDNFSLYYLYDEYQSLSLIGKNTKELISFENIGEKIKLGSEKRLNIVTGKHNGDYIFINRLSADNFQSDYLKMCLVFAINMLGPIIGTVVNFHQNGSLSHHQKYIYRILLKHALLNPDHSVNLLFRQENVKRLISSAINGSIFYIPSTMDLFEAHSSMIFSFKKLYNGYHMLSDYKNDVELFLPKTSPIYKFFPTFHGEINFKDEFAIGIMQIWSRISTEKLNDYIMKSNNSFSDEDINNLSNLSIKQYSDLLLQIAIKLRYIYDYHRLEISKIQKESQDFQNFRIDRLTRSSSQQTKALTIDKIIANQSIEDKSYTKNVANKSINHISQIIKKTIPLRSLLKLDIDHTQNLEERFELEQELKIIEIHKKILIESYPYIHQLNKISKYVSNNLP